MAESIGMRVTRKSCLLLSACSLLLACHSQAQVVDYRIDSSVKHVIYDGIITSAGVDQAEPIFDTGMYLSITSYGGSIASVARMAEIVDRHGGYVKVSGHCYAECAIGFLAHANEVRVGYGATLLFTSETLALAEGEVSKSLMKCVPNSAQPSSYLWFSPEVIMGAGAHNAEFEWVLDPSARESYERLAGRRVVWVDSCSLG